MATEQKTMLHSGFTVTVLNQKVFLTVEVFKEVTFTEGFLISSWKILGTDSTINQQIRVLLVPFFIHKLAASVHFKITTN